MNYNNYIFQLQQTINYYFNKLQFILKENHDLKRDLSCDRTLLNLRSNELFELRTSLYQLIQNSSEIDKNDILKLLNLK